MWAHALLWHNLLASVLATPVLNQSTSPQPQSYPLHITPHSALPKRQDSTEQMDENTQKNYQAILTLGSGQQFSVLVDTGSGDLFLPTAGAGPGNTVQPDSSVVPYPGSPGCNEAYGGNSQGIIGTVYTAPYKFAGTTTPSSSAFCLVSNEGTYADDADGVFGLGPCTGNVGKTTSNCPLAALGWGSFGIYLSSDDLGGGGFITPNDVNSDLYYGDFAWENLIPGAAHWTFDLGGGAYSVNGFQGNLAPQYAFIDTGNPLIKVDAASAEAIWAQVGADANTGAIDCGQRGVAPDIVFTFGSGNEYTVSSNLYVVQNARTGACRCGVVKQPQSGPANFGALFVKAYYTYFDNGEGYLGFAQSIG